MTREEAKEILREMKDECNDKFHKVRYVTKEEALGVAISALEQKPICIGKIEFDEDKLKEIVHDAVLKIQEPCEDAISREYLKKIAQSEGTYGYVSAYDIATAPPVTQKSEKWIPVSERLPEDVFGCLVTVEEDDIHGEPQRVIYPDFVGYDGETWNDANGKPISFEVMAWMPLPEPYREGSE